MMKRETLLNIMTCNFFHSNHCTLYAFLMDYIKDVFLGQIHADNGKKQES